MNTKTSVKQYRLQRSARDPVALTALLYLKEALLAERYEECEGMIQTAYEFGATTNDVLFLLEDPRRSV